MTCIQIKGLQALTVSVSDMAVSEEFYSSIPGFEREGEIPPGDGNVLEFAGTP